MRAWGRLLRLSLAPTAIADIAAGNVLGRGGWDRSVLFLVLASLCVYHGGMALNDWADRAEDAKLRPDRPIPSGRIAAPAALAVAVLLLAGGPALASLASLRSAAALGAVALLAGAYDLGVRGPTLLALCRGGNLLAGFLHGDADPRIAFLPALAYAGYVAAVSSLARLEDAEPDVIARSHPARALRVAALLLFLAPFTSLRASFWGLAAALAIAALGASTLAAAARRRAAWTNAEICRAVGLGLRRLLVFTSALAFARGTPEGAVVGGAILCGYPIAYALRAGLPAVLSPPLSLRAEPGERRLAVREATVELELLRFSQELAEAWTRRDAGAREVVGRDPRGGGSLQELPSRRLEPIDGLAARGGARLGEREPFLEVRAPHPADAGRAAARERRLGP